MTKQEEYTVSGKNLVGKIKDLIREGNIRRVRLLHEGKALIDIPLSVGVPAAAVGVLAAPVVAAIAAIAALVTECTIQVEKEDFEASAKK